MKTATKIWIIIATVFLIAGAILFALVMSANNWEFSAIVNTKLETRTVEINENFGSILIDGNTENIVFIPSEDGKCKVVFDELEKENHVVEVVDGTLLIKADSEMSWIDYITLFSFDSTKITVYLPQGDYSSLTIKGSTGNVDLPNDFTFGNVDISVSTGGVKFNSSVSGILRISASTGNVSVSDIETGALELSASTGKISVDSVKCDGELSLKVSTGRTELSDVSASSIKSNGSTGNLIMNRVTVSNEMRIERSTGDVNFDSCDAGEIYIKTSTGDVRGSLLTEKVFITHSSTGRINVPDTVSGGRCEISTGTGDIDITINQ